MDVKTGSPDRQSCRVHEPTEPLTRERLAAELAEAVRQWSPYERVPRKYPFRGQPVQRVTECRYCGARGRTPRHVDHEESCAYRRRRETLEQAREEGLI